MSSFGGPTGPTSWIRFKRRWWTWLTNPWKSLYPWGLGIPTRGGAVIWVSSVRQTDVQHARRILEQEFDPTPHDHNMDTSRPPRSGRKAKI